MNEEVDGIITNGYPNVSFEELNLSNENDAYFATQIAIWSCLEGYDVSKIKSNNMAVLNAIKTIYSRGMAQNKEVKYGNVEYISPNESIQRVVMVFEKLHPAQEG
nr:thioester domain-containing protein [uncultured Clostridium sp.]